MEDTEEGKAREEQEALFFLQKGAIRLANKRGLKWGGRLRLILDLVEAERGDTQADERVERAVQTLRVRSPGERRAAWCEIAGRYLAKARKCRPSRKTDERTIPYEKRLRSLEPERDRIFAGMIEDLHALDRRFVALTPGGVAKLMDSEKRAWSRWKGDRLAYELAMAADVEPAGTSFDAFRKSASRYREKATN